MAEESDARLLIVGGEIRASDEPDEFYRRLQSVLGLFVQVKNLSVLLGAGPSYPLGSPRIRDMDSDAILSRVREEGQEELLDSDSAAFLRGLVESAGGAIDLERLLGHLSAAARLLEAPGEGGGSEAVLALGGREIKRDALLSLRKALNHALARRCDLPRADALQGEELRSDPLRSHRTFFQRLLRARRRDLPRIRVFTTNYDLVIEKALDEAGITYLDGFSGTVERVFRPESYLQDVYLPPEPDQRRLIRVPEVLYLYKLHGSISWRPRHAPPGFDRVVQDFHPIGTDAEELVLIYPTPGKEGDALGYPYSVLFKAFSESLNQSDSALLVIGYGFADDHINRVVLQAFANPSFQLMVVSPSSVISPSTHEEMKGHEPQFLDTGLGRLAGIRDPRITVVTGSEAGTFADIADTALPAPAEPEREGRVEKTTAVLTEALMEHEQEKQ